MASCDGGCGACGCARAASGRTNGAVPIPTAPTPIVATAGAYTLGDGGSNKNKDAIVSHGK
eukprot:scaffold2319_cov107-Cylindrotheca_fusiformis.AAC.1